ncbi:MAG: ABC transporter substrate-binding protein [Burkholderiales bacterium]
MSHRCLIAGLVCTWAASFLSIGAHAADLRIGLSADVTTMDPHFLASQPNLTVGYHVFDALTHVDEKARLIPGLATSWRAVDATTWEFKLRPGVKFHDGSDLTAEDVMFSLERPLNIKGSPGGFAAYVRAIVGKEIVDKQTIRLKTAAPYGALPEDLNSVMIVSKKIAATAAPEDFESGRATIGTGPYKFVRFARGDRVEYTRNDSYWGGRPAWDKVTLRIMPNDPVRTAALLSGELDVIEHAPPADREKLIQNKQLRLEQTVSWRTIFLHLDQYRNQPPHITDSAGKPLAKNPFMDVRVRRAMSMAINRTAIAERVMEKLAVPAANIVSPGVFGHNPQLKPEAYNPEGAKKLLAEAGYPNGFTVTLSGPNNRYINDEQVLQAVAQMLTRVGIQTKVEALPLNAFLGKVRKEETAFAMLGWGSFAGDLALRSLLATPNTERAWGAWNWGRSSNPKLDQLIGQSLASVDAKARESIAREAAAVAMNDVSLIPLHHQIVSWAMKSTISYVPRTDEFTFAHLFKPK